ncbi:MAG: metallophosphoesterase family protein [Oleiphilaceae bacterium]|nr:metallophosphoesterase family protein [Oleiphilaceae bacterium]
MLEQDLGALHEPLLVFGGPYSNLQATRAMRAEAERMGVPPQHVICTGDVVAYCADAAATVDEIRDWGSSVVMGNCEESLGNEDDDCGCGFEEGTACSLLSIAWYRYANQQLDALQRAWMRQLPRSIVFTMQGQRVRCVHGSVNAINQFIFASTPQEKKQQQLAASGADIVVGGHCGVPFGTKLSAGWWLNAGVIGMPANDGQDHTWYMLLTPHENRIRVTWHRLHYDVSAAQHAMTQAGLPPDYRDALSTGLWPSMDVLPERERSLAGKQLELADLLI